MQFMLVVVTLLTVACGGGGGATDTTQAPGGTIDFEEYWESAVLGSYSPAKALPIINADEGDWIIGDTVSSSDNCGPVLNSAEIVSGNTGKALRLNSVNSMSGCSDNIWVVIAEVPQVGLNAGIRIPISADTRISFDASGSLINPQIHSNACLVPPCSDSISLTLVDNNGNALAYIIRSADGAQPNTNHNMYREIFLDTANSTFSRKVLVDFRSIPNFRSNNASIVSVEFKVQDHGNAILDNLIIKDVAAPPNNPGPVSVTEADLLGVWRRTDPGHTHKGKEYLPNGTGYLGNFNSGPFTRVSGLTWALSGVTLTDIRIDGIRVEDVTSFSTNSMTTQRQDNGNFLNWQRQ